MTGVAPPSDSLAAAGVERWDSVGRRLSLAFAALIALLLAASAVVYAQAMRQQEAVNELGRHTLPMQVATDDVRVALDDAQRSLRGYLLTGQPRFLEPYHRARREYPALVSRLRDLARPGQRAMVDAAVSAADRWWRTTRHGPRVQPRSDAAAQLTIRGEQRFDAFLAAVDRINDHLNAQVERLRATQRQDVSTSRLVLLATVLLTVGIAALVAWRTRRALASPLREVQETVGRLREGDRAARAPVAGPVEVRTVAAAINDLADETDRLQVREDERAALHEKAYALGASVRADLDVDRVIRVTTASAGEAFDADAAVVQLLHDDNLTPAAGAWGSDGGRRDWKPLGCSVGAAWELYADREASTRVAEDSGGHPWSVVDLPFGTGWRLLGVLSLGRVGTGQPWRPSEIEALQIVAAELAYGIHQARLFAHEREVAEQLRALDRTKTDFVATVSHELRTPLTNIGGYVEMLRDEDAGPVSAAQSQMLEVVERNIARLRSLIEDLLTLSRIEVGSYQAARSRVDVAELLAAVRGEHAEAARAKGLTLTVSPPQRRLTVDADQEQLRRALGNLVSNAVKFTPDGGQVTVAADGRLRGDEGLVTFTVSDTGVGIPESEQDRLFDRFFRGEGAMRDQVPGTGLGLAIVRAIVDNHGGTLRIQSEEGAGTTVSVVMPAVKPTRGSGVDAAHART